MAKATLEERFWSKVDKAGPVPLHRPDLGPCWLWTGFVDRDGYSRMAYGERGQSTFAHNVAWKLLRGPIDDGLEFDHLCKIRRCVNPWHGERTTHPANVLSGESFSAVNARKTHCAQGHPYDEANTYHRTRGGRDCRQCRRASMKRYKQRQKEQRWL